MKNMCLPGFLSFCAVGLAASGVAAERPNVLFIAVDDLRPQLGCYGHEQIKSPNIDALAERGILFENAYCQQAVCAPSRISLMTGARPDTTGITDLKHPLRKTTPGLLSMPQYFKSKGYETISLGKIYHHHDDDDGIGWSKPAWRPYMGPHKWKGRDYLDPKSWEIMKKSGKKNGGPPFESPDVADDEYPDGKTAAKAIEELRRLKDSGKPFFLGVGFKKPHLPFNSPKRYWDMYPVDKIKLPEQRTWPKGMPSVAANGLTKAWELSNYDALPDKWPLPDDYAKTLIRGYYACVTYTDAQVGKVVDELDRLGLSTNTIIVLWGDHGWKLDEYSSWCKHTNFEIDTHAPLMLAAPGHKQNQRTKALVEFVDIFPTLCDLSGLKIPPSCEGSSFVPLLDHPGRKWKEAAFSQFPRYKNLMGYTMRYGRWRYTEWIDRGTGKIKYRELYDHAKSRIASVNQADNPEYAELITKLSAIMDKGQGWKKIRAELK